MEKLWSIALSKVCEAACHGGPEDRLCGVHIILDTLRAINRLPKPFFASVLMSWITDDALPALLDACEAADTRDLGIALQNTASDALRLIREQIGSSTFDDLSGLYRLPKRDPTASRVEGASRPLSRARYLLGTGSSLSDRLAIAAQQQYGGVKCHANIFRNIGNAILSSHSGGHSAHQQQPYLGTTPSQKPPSIASGSHYNYAAKLGPASRASTRSGSGIGVFSQESPIAGRPRLPSRRVLSAGTHGGLRDGCGSDASSVISGTGPRPRPRERPAAGMTEGEKSLLETIRDSDGGAGRPLATTTGIRSATPWTAPNLATHPHQAPPARPSLANTTSPPGRPSHRFDDDSVLMASPFTAMGTSPGPARAEVNNQRTTRAVAAVTGSRKAAGGGENDDSPDSVVRKLGFDADNTPPNVRHNQNNTGDAFPSLRTPPSNGQKHSSPAPGSLDGSQLSCSDLVTPSRVLRKSSARSGSVRRVSRGGNHTLMTLSPGSSTAEFAAAMEASQERPLSPKGEQAVELTCGDPNDQEGTAGASTPTHRPASGLNESNANSDDDLLGDASPQVPKPTPHREDDLTQFDCLTMTECPRCGKAFRTRADVQNHMLTCSLSVTNTAARLPAL
ncbi:hypothetical protein FOZ63_033274, partial [Perkinsus olseni]